MSFSINVRDIPYLHDYADAHSYWASKKPFKDSVQRPLERNSRKKRHMSIWKGVDKSIYCTLHNTDVVRFHENGCIEVDMSYRSASTDSFINAIIPYVRIWANKTEQVVWEEFKWEGPCRGLLVESSTAVFNSNLILQNPRPIQWRTLNTKKANQLRRDYNYDTFRVWRQAFEAMSGTKFHGHYVAIRRDDALALLRAGQTKWKELATQIGNDDLLAYIYKAHPDVIDVEVRECFTTVNQYKNWLNLDRKYG